MTEVIKHEPDQLSGGSHLPKLTETFTVKAGKEHKRGKVFAFDADGKAITPTDAATVKVVLAKDVDATSADTEGLFYTTGIFNGFAIDYSGLDENAVKEALHIRSIFLK
tara:strand:- start:7858 stop:8184 length:327 start_codon:yes stop_codon:yes gene_type:complete